VVRSSFVNPKSGKNVMMFVRASKRRSGITWEVSSPFFHWRDFPPFLTNLSQDEILSNVRSCRKQAKYCCGPTAQKYEKNCVFDVFCLLAA